MLYESITLVGVEANRRLSPARSAVKPVTPGSVKILMVGEAGVIGFLAYWIVSEYIFNAYFHDYVDQLLGTHGTTFTAVIGLGIGLVTAVAASRLVATLLFGLAPTDAFTILGAITMMVLVSAMAGYLPARRAARVDPLVALHYE